MAGRYRQNGALVWACFGVAAPSKITVGTVHADTDAASPCHVSLALAASRLVAREQVTKPAWK